MMLTWNRSYLEAMSVPVWVSRQAAVETVADETATEQVEAEAEAQVEQASSFGFISVAGSTQAKVYILVTTEQNLQQAKSNFQSLSQAWKQWQNTALPLALVQLVEQADSTAKAEPIDGLKDKQLLFSSNQTIDLPSLTIERAPSLDWQSASDKKAWWQLLQKLV